MILRIRVRLLVCGVIERITAFGRDLMLRVIMRILSLRECRYY